MMSPDDRSFHHIDLADRSPARAMMVDGILATGVVSAIVAIAMVTVVLTLNTSELNRFSRLLGPTAFIALFIPCLWMLLQVLPISIRSLANPVWVSASTALDKPFVGAI